MVIQVNDQIEQELRRLAGHQGRALADVVEAALRSYIEAEAITDIEATDIAVTQLAMLSELPEIEGAEGAARRPGPMRRAEVWWAELPPPVGPRPVVVLTRDTVCDTIGAVVVALVWGTSPQQKSMSSIGL